MTAKTRVKERFERILYFFPFQLLIAHIKSNHVLILFWLLLFALVGGGIADKYGIQYLFLDPEYLNNVSIWSFGILGFSVGGFVMAFNMSSYVMNGTKFPFIATLSRPFFKYCINNSFLPLIFLIYFFYKTYNFQINNEFCTFTNLIYYLTSFLVGYILFILLSFMYFFTANANINKVVNVQQDESATVKYKKISLSVPSQKKWYEFFIKGGSWKVSTYLSSPFKIKLARSSGHYKKETLQEIINKHHISASVFEIIVVATILILGLFKDNDWLIIPAGASIIFLFTIFILLASAFYVWFKSWSSVITIGLFLLLNYFSQFPQFRYINKAYGINYDNTPVKYDINTLKELRYSGNYEQDIIYHKNILNKWKEKIYKKYKNKKPKLIFVNTSGGGSRSALWTFRVLQYVDSILKGQLLEQTILITGSSGGMLGASYIRELFYLKKLGKIKSYYYNKYNYNISADLLNPIVFNMGINDFFFRFQKFKYNGYNYVKDRAYFFEKQFNKNTNYILDHPIKYYREPEKNALIPLLVLSPSIVNDGRQLIISPQPLSFLIYNIPEQKFIYTPIVENVEFSRLFRDFDPDNLRFTSALRMNATFPFITPIVTLPTKPAIEVIDAGLRDNYGLVTTIKYIYHLRNWILKNTSGVVIIQIRDKFKEREIETSTKKTILESIVRPFGTVYYNLFTLQDYYQEDMVQYASSWLDKRLHIVLFQLRNDKENPISLSWHLTSQEKHRVMESIFYPENQYSIITLKKLLK